MLEIGQITAGGVEVTKRERRLTCFGDAFWGTFVETGEDVLLVEVHAPMEACEAPETGATQTLRFEIVAPARPGTTLVPKQAKRGRGRRARENVGLWEAIDDKIARGPFPQLSGRASTMSELSGGR